MEDQEVKPETTTEQKIQRGVTGAMDVLVLVQAALVAKKLVGAVATKIRR